MFTRDEKIGFAISGALFIIGGVICLYNYTKEQYLKGKIDAAKEILSYFEQENLHLQKVMALEKLNDETAE